MPETMNINARRSIHRGDSQLSDSEESISDYENGSQSFTHSEPNSDSENLNHHRRSQSPGIHRRNKISGDSHSIPKITRSPNQQLQRGNYPAPVVLESCSPKFMQPNIALKLPRIVILLTGIFAVCIVVYACIPENNSKSKTCSFEKLRKEYPGQDPKVWQYLTFGIESILNKTVNSPGVYLFVHQGGESVTEVVRNIASHSSSCFDQDMHTVEMESKDFNSDEVLEDYGYAIKKFKEKIQNRNVILIANLNEIPANAARALHTICDTKSPIVPNIVIYLTLTIPTVDGGNVESITEDTLKNLWGRNLKYNELDPLITRITDQVIPLKS